MFSVTMIPISTIVPIAMAMPERATMLASTPKTFIATKQSKTARGSNPEIRIELLRCIIITSTTMMVISISRERAERRVPRVSYIRSVLS